MRAENEQRGFASPREALSMSYLDGLVRRTSSRVAGSFLAAFGRRMPSRSKGLEAIFTRLRDEPDNEIGFETWPSLGRLRHALIARDEALSWASAVGLALCLAERGREVKFEVYLDGEAMFRFGRYALPPSASVSCTSDGQTAEIHVTHRSSRRELLFSRSRGEWVGKLQESRAVRNAGKERIFITSLAPSVAALSGVPVATLSHLELAWRYEAALDVIARCAPSFLPWVTRSIRLIVPVVAPYGTTLSKSFVGYPGVAAVSYEGPPTSIADALVHEASHQHWDLMQLCGDEALRYPATCQGASGRTTEERLVAYHAFVNTLLFYRDCLTGGLGDDDLCHHQERSYSRAMGELRRSLEHADLAPAERALFESLSEFAC